MSRTHTLDQNPDIIEPFVNMLVEGATREVIAETLNINKGTVTEWKKHPTVQRKWGKALEERSNRILSHTDQHLEQRLIAKAETMSVDQLLRIRHEFAGEKVTITGGDASDALAQLMKAAHADPDLAAALARVMPDAD